MDSKTLTVVTRHKIPPDYDILEIHHGEPISDKEIFFNAYMIACTIDHAEAVAFGVKVLARLPKGERVFCYVARSDSAGGNLFTISHTGATLSPEELQELNINEGYNTVRILGQDA